MFSMVASGFVNRWSGVQISHPAPPCNVLDPLTLMQNFSPWQQISIALAILAAVFYFALQIPWVAALFG
jgi:hypothetical protein